MTIEEILEAITDDKTMPFIQPEQLSGIVDFVIKNYKPSLPSNLDEAAVEQANLIYPENIRMGHVAKHDVNLLTRRGFIKGFKAGAVRMAGQGWSRELEVKADVGGYPYIPQIELYDYDKDIPLAKAGEKVKVIVIKENNYDRKHL